MKKMQKNFQLKGQVGVEILFIVGFLFIILAATLFIYFRRSSEIASTEVFLAAKKICNELQTGINQAASSNSGFRTTVDIPAKLVAKSYTLTVDASNRTILVKWDSSLFTCPLSFQNVSNGTAYLFSIASGKNGIRTKDDGVVIFEKV